MDCKHGAWVLITAFFLSGCTAQAISNYSPSSAMSIDGDLEVGFFSYIPSINNVVDANEIRHTGAVNIVLDKDMSDYIRMAVINESRFVGISVGESNNVLTGEIIEYLRDNIWARANWDVRIRYVVTNKEMSTICYDWVMVTKGKFYGYMDDVTKINIEHLFSDKEFVACIQN